MFQDFKPVLITLMRFLVIYLVILGLYQLYLNYFSGTGLDPISKWIAGQSGQIQNFFGYETQLVDEKARETTWFYVSGEYRTRMVEGCNAISIIILFLAFIFAFYKGLKTFVFAGIGVLIIHIMNVLRISGLNILYVIAPEYSHMGHQYLFPAIIYGTIVVLWLVWIKFFALKANENF